MLPKVVLSSAVAIFAFLLLTSITGAVDYTITGNGAGSESSIKISGSSQTTVIQDNSAHIVNDIDVDADTGGNKAGGNSANTNIKTGDSTINVSVTNQVNTNNAKVACCSPSPSKKITPTPDPGSKITSTPKPNGTNGGNGGGSGNGGSSTSSSSGGVGGPNGEILGLSATSGDPLTQYAFYFAGSICLALGSAILRHKNSV